MDSVEKDVGALGFLFQTIIADMKSSAPVWDDFTIKSAKLHSVLKTTLMAISAFLESFQKLADAATNTRGATREIGTALTRLCMRHKSIEKKLNEFNGALLRQMVLPLQEKSEEWKRNVGQLDKEHAKESKRARIDIKKASSDTIRLQKKARKGSTNSMLGKSEVQIKLDNALQDRDCKYANLEDTEKKFVRDALIQERGRFCDFITGLKPVVDHEIDMLTEVTHLQEILHSLCMQASEPGALPPASQQVILDIKGTDYSITNFQTPPSSPSSLGSRKSSMCSISSMASSTSAGSSSHSPSHRARLLSQPLPAARLSSVSSQDSGFTSQDTLVLLKPPSPLPPDVINRKSSLQDSSSSSSSGGSTESSATTPSPSGWSNWPSAGPYADRPHTISSAYEKSHGRPPLSAAMFEPPSESNPYAVPVLGQRLLADIRPPLPGPKPRSRAVAPPIVPGGRQGAAQGGELPIYVNQNDLVYLAASKAQLDEVNEEEEDIQDEDDEDDDEATTPTPNRNQDIIAVATAAVAAAAAEVTAVPANGNDQLDTAVHDAEDIKVEQQEEVVKEKPTEISRIIAELDQTTADLQSMESELAARTNADKLAIAADDNYVVLEPSSSSSSSTGNSPELAAAIRELEASTAALELVYTHRHSVHCSASSGYASMDNTPACSDDPIPTHETDLPEHNHNDAEDDTHDLGVDGNDDDDDDDVDDLPPPPPELLCAPTHYATLPHRSKEFIDQPVSTTGVLRRASMHGTGRPPPPPLRRTPTAPEPQYAEPMFVCAPMAPAVVAAAAPIYMTPHVVPSVSRVTCVEAAPPPPPPPNPPAPEHEDLPLPPPPEELEADLYASTQQTNGSNNVPKEGRRAKVGSIVDTHAGIIADLNAKFSESEDSGAPGAVGGLAGQIQRGISLRRTWTNDRSAPSFK